MINRRKQTLGCGSPRNLDAGKSQRVVSESAEARLATHGSPETQIRDDAADKSVLRAIGIGEGLDGGCEPFFQNRSGAHRILRQFWQAHSGHWPMYRRVAAELDPGFLQRAHLLP